ncbi:MAG: hypothetical protein A2204_05610 [Elusimicrobia bacterium RIFOXYA1_FULL_47_7]|nr:MAG: hypothetical protein A2278_01740 [Elusimicrobia bacterium RIFOXYA12_FULL_49_49]OGS07691.1 MAG: hypothetical protein A2204_05610 [Elusimicrobia bacterium RIFOXYA1_FULL_47_7]OGS11660.1 MAG: hypothetical protein A2386_03280 [Elusimicrobia bacterium RIFOXYB1_FULL_48_9]OGS16771.1 MAG: hypothetical protein A2251_05190 [Elusimicrobia bacterium RIFOXYA2_FULL_47_53]OGS31999.1 MAG: hypothetical protein A2323_07965 [Elusimicrobia bacterium RIFOXYB2_FULL_46_23]
MNVMFVYSLYNIASITKPLKTPEIIQFGISYISSYLKANGHNTRLLILSRLSGKANEALILENINRFKPKVIAFTAVSSEYPFIVETARFIRKHFPDKYFIIGGPHVSMNPDGVLDDFDALCVSEGEMPMLELVNQLESGNEPSGINNLWIKNKNGVKKNPARPFLSELDRLPFPDRDMWNEWIDDKPNTRFSVLLGRGCPFECTYCCNHVLKKLSPGQYTRYRSPENIVSEIREIVEKYPDKNEIYLEVENIGIKKEWVVDLCARLAEFNGTQKQPISFGANLRIIPNMDLRSIFKAFKQSNFRFVNIGLESGSEKIRRDILKRDYSNDDIIKAAETAREFGLQVSFLNMIGIPGETEKEFKETIELNRICRPDWTGYSIFYPYQGTVLYDYCEKLGLLNDSLPTEMEREKATLDLPGFSKKRIDYNYNWFEYFVFKGRKPLPLLLAKAFWLKLRSSLRLFNFYRKLRNKKYY